MTLPKIEVGWTPQWAASCQQLTIRINDLLHLCLHPSAMPSFQSWLWDVNGDGTSMKYCIEYYDGKSEILTEYESRETWEEILRQLEAIFYSA